MRKWISQTILGRVVQEIDRVNEKLVNFGCIDSLIGGKMSGESNLSHNLIFSRFSFRGKFIYPQTIIHVKKLTNSHIANDYFLHGIIRSSGVLAEETQRHIFSVQ